MEGEPRVKTRPFTPASLYAVANPKAFLVAVVYCPWRQHEVARLQDTPHGAVLTITLRGAPSKPLTTPPGAPDTDLSRLPLSLMRISGRAMTGKRQRNFCYAWEDEGPEAAWTVICHCGAGVVTAGEVQAAAVRGRSGRAPGGLTFTPHPL